MPSLYQHISLKIRTKDLVEKIIPAMGHEPKIVKL